MRWRRIGIGALLVSGLTAACAVAPPVQPTPTGQAPSGPSALPTALPSPSGSPGPIGPAALGWEPIGAIPAGTVEGLVSFDLGYVAYGTTSPNFLPGAWFSRDGRTWSPVELAGMVPCGDGNDPTAGGAVYAGATNGQRVVLVGSEWPGEERNCGDSRPVAWSTDDGVTWAKSNGVDPSIGSFAAASSVWPIAGGWQAAVNLGDLMIGLWQSEDGLTWRLIEDLILSEDGESWQGVADARGTTLLSMSGGDGLGLQASEDGATWHDVRFSTEEGWTVRHMLPADVDGRPWTLAISRNDSQVATATSPDLAVWQQQPFPKPAIGAFAPTGSGIIATGFVPCLDTGGPCPDPEHTQYVSADGLTWAPLGAHVPATSIADGPAGVLAVGPEEDLAGTRVWGLVAIP